MFESHITVTGVDDQEFREACLNLCVKPVIIEGDTASPERQMMTARFHKAKYQPQALKEMHLLADQLPGKVIRRKLEKIVGKNPALPEHLYLEFHTKYEVDRKDLEDFVTKVLESGGHTSSNSLKKTDNPETEFRFATARTKETYLKLLGNLSDFQKINSIMECVVFDDNPHLDQGWYECLSCPIKSVPF